MDFAPDTLEDDAAALSRRRANLRAFVAEVVEVVQALPMPETYLEAERSVRVVTVADRFIVRVPEEEDDTAESFPHDGKEKPAIPPARKALRRYADDLMAAVARIPKPDSYLEGERAARYALACDRMLVQLYSAAKPKTRNEDDFDNDAHDGRPTRGKQPNWRLLILQKMTGMNTADAEAALARYDSAAPPPDNGWNDLSPEETLSALRAELLRRYADQAARKAQKHQTDSADTPNKPVLSEPRPHTFAPPFRPPP